MGGGRRQQQTAVSRGEAVGYVAAKHMEALIDSLAVLRVEADVVVVLAPKDTMEGRLCIAANLLSGQSSVSELLERAYADVLSRSPDIDTRGATT